MKSSGFSTSDLLSIYDAVRGNSAVMQKYDNARGFLVNYEDMLEAYIQFARNVELRIPYRWTKRDSDQSLYVIEPGDCEGLDYEKVIKNEAVYGEIFPTYYLMIFLLAKCIILIKRRENVKFVPMEIKDYDVSAISNIQTLIKNKIKEVLSNGGEGECEKLNIDEELTRIMSGILLSAKIFPNFRYETLEPLFIVRCLIDDADTPPDELVELDIEKDIWNDVDEN